MTMGRGASVNNAIKYIEAKENDFHIMLDIYNHYITNTTATFDHQNITLDEPFDSFGKQEQALLLLRSMLE